MPRGGKRAGAGRKPIEGKRLPLSVMIREDYLARFNRICDRKNLTQWEGIERLIDSYELRQNSFKLPKKSGAGK